MSSEPLKQMLKRHEGLRLKPYRCTAGHMTIGYGHNIDAKPLPLHIQETFQRSHAITLWQAEELLDVDIGVAENSCRRIWPQFDSLDNVRRDALTDFVFNVGEGRAKLFVKAVAAIKAQDWNTAAKELTDSLWYGQVGDRAEEIVYMVQTGERLREEDT